jgi:hypothetical protein
MQEAEGKKNFSYGYKAQLKEIFVSRSSRRDAPRRQEFNPKF